MAVSFTPGQVLTAAELNASIGDSGWITVGSFTNSWGAGSVAPAYRLVGSTVYLRGRMSAGTANTVAFTLPSGYQPSTTQSLVSTNLGNVANQITISTSGQLTPLSSQVTMLDGLSFFIN